MTKVWDGPTPYDSTKCRTPDELLSVLGMVEGYRAAMNSPEVRALYEALKNLLTTKPEILRALADYESGLKENDDATLPIP